MKKNFLFIVTEITSANGVCTINVMKELRNKGNNVYCIINKETNKNYFEKEGIYYFTVKPRLFFRLNNYSKKIKNKLIKKIFLKFVFLINKVKMILSTPCWPLISPLYSFRIYLKSKKIVKKYNIGCIVPVFSQIDTLIASYLIKKQYDSISYIPYFLDSLSGGYGPKYFSENWVIKRGLFWERKLLFNANKIIMMNSVKEHYERLKEVIPYYSRIVFSDLPLLVEQKIKTDVKKDGKIRILYAGTLPNGIRNPKIFLELFSKIKNDNILLTFVGADDCEILNKAAEKDNRIEVQGRVSYNKIKKIEQNADIFLNFGNTNSNMTPSKIFEYMSFNKPIISTCPVKNEPSIIYLNKYKKSYLIKEYDLEALKTEPKKLESYILKCINDNLEYDNLIKEFRKNLPSYTANIIFNEVEKSDKNENYCANK